MLAFDGSKTTRKGVEMVAESSLFKGLPCHIVMVGDDNTSNRIQLDWAIEVLQDAGFEAPASITDGEVETVLVRLPRKTQYRYADHGGLWPFDDPPLPCWQHDNQCYPQRLGAGIAVALIGHCLWRDPCSRGESGMARTREQWFRCEKLSCG